MRLLGRWIAIRSRVFGFSTNPPSSDSVLNLDEDDLAELMIADSYLEGNWTTDGTNATIKFDDEQDKTASIFVSNGKLILGQAEESRLVFSKGDMEAYFADQSDGSDTTMTDGDDGDDAGEAVELVDEVINDITPVTVADDDTCTIKVTGKGTDFTSDPGYRLTIENKTKKTLYITSDDVFQVGDKKVEPGLGEIIDPGATAETFMYFPQDELGGGLDALKSVSGKVIIGDDDTGDEIATYEFKMD